MVRATKVPSHFFKIFQNLEFIVPTKIRTVVAKTLQSKPVWRPIFTQENKHWIEPDRNKIEPAHWLSVPIFWSSLNLWSATQMIKSWSIFNFFWLAVWIIQDGKSPIRSDAYFPEWKPAFNMHVLKPSVFHHRFNQIMFLKIETTPRKISFLGVM